MFEVAVCLSSRSVLYHLRLAGRAGVERPGDAELADQQETSVCRMLPIHHPQPLRLWLAAGCAYWLNVVLEIWLVVLDGTIADEDFANRARKVNGHWLILAELAAIVV